MSTRSVALYQAVLDDVSEFCPSTPVGLKQPPPDASLSEFRCLTLLNTLLKKWVPADTRAPDKIAKEKFLASNKRCGDWAFRPEFESDRLLYGEFRKQLDQFFHPYGRNLLESFSVVLEKARVGPGSAVGAEGQSMYAKLFSSPLTVTSEALYLIYKCYIRQFHTWEYAENHRYSHYGKPCVVDCSRTSFVPKTADVSRMICVEPSLNMFFQLGLGRLMEEWLEESYGISMSNQPDINRRLARIGSYDGSFSTIDLSSASDSISLSLCREVLPEWLFQTLLELRSPFTSVSGEKVRLEMMSTMGNGFTFPLQTILFSSIIRAAHRVAGIPLFDRANRNWSCFGDDLICDTRAYRNVRRLLELTGFEINSTKTFFEGPFRESCGTDWLSGQPVRGVYIKRLRTTQDLCVAINLLNEWSAVTGVPLKRACNQLLSWMRGKFLPVPYVEGYNTGVRVPFSFLKREHYEWDENLSIMYRRFQSRPFVIRVTEEEICSPKGVRKLQYNPNGLLCSFLHGELRNSMYTVRHDRVYYFTKQVCTPHWDYAPQELPLDRGVAPWPRWEIAVLINLSNP
jgi:hypothetical protein